MAPRRRSLIQFEAWLQGEIDQTEAAVATLTVKTQELAQQTSVAQVKLEALRAVQARVAQVPDNQTEDATAQDSILDERA